MSFQVVIGSNPEEFDRLQQIRDLLNWNRQVLTDTYSDGPYDELVPVTAEQLDVLHDWINGLCTLITNVGFAIEETPMADI